MLTDRDRKMSNLDINWDHEIGTIAGPFLPTDTKDSWLGRAYREISKINPKVSFRHLRSIYYGHVPDPKFSVGKSILSAADQARLDEAKRDVEKVATLYRVHAERLAAIDEDFNREQINALVSAARILGERNSPGNKG